MSSKFVRGEVSSVICELEVWVEILCELAVWLTGRYWMSNRWVSARKINSSALAMEFVFLALTHRIVSTKIKLWSTLQILYLSVRTRNADVNSAWNDAGYVYRKLWCIFQCVNSLSPGKYDCDSKCIKRNEYWYSVFSCPCDCVVKRPLHWWHFVKQPLLYLCIHCLILQGLVTDICVSKLCHHWFR